MLFKKGDMVTWNGRPLRSFLQDVGPGPYEVQKVELVPENVRKEAGHDQWVTIKGHVFSGYWFQLSVS
jgi:hypothetical protein